MKNIFSVVLFFFFFSGCYSQKPGINEDEYEIYGSFIGNINQQNCSIQFRVPDMYLSVFKMDENDTIFKMINSLEMKSVDYKKLVETSLKYSENKKFNCTGRALFFSPIYLKNRDEAYFIAITQCDKLKPSYYYFRAKRNKQKWELEDYEEFY